MTSQRFVVCFTGADPPGWASRHAAENGIDLLPLSGGDAQARIAELRPDGYVMNDPEYGPYLSVELAGAARDLRIVVYHGQTRTAADYEPFMDVTALRERGIVLTTGPGTVTEAVSEGTMGCAQPQPRGRKRRLQGGRCVPARAASSTARRRARIVGLGSIGRRVARLAVGFGMTIVYASRARKFELEDELGAEFLPLGELFERSHYVSVHTPLGTTEGLIGREVGWEACLESLEAVEDGREVPHQLE